MPALRMRTALPRKGRGSELLAGELSKLIDARRPTFAAGAAGAADTLAAPVASGLGLADSASTGLMFVTTLQPQLPTTRAIRRRLTLAACW